MQQEFDYLLTSLIVRDLKKIVTEYLLPQVNDIIVQQSFKNDRVHRNYFYLVVSRNAKYMRVASVEACDAMFSFPWSHDFKQGPIRKVTHEEFLFPTHIVWSVYDKKEQYTQTSTHKGRGRRRKKSYRNVPQRPRKAPFNP